MYYCERLTRNNISVLKSLNENRKIFNELNEDFFEIYNSVNPVKQYLLRGNIKLIATGNKYAGYCWLEKNRRNCYNLRSFCAADISLSLPAFNCFMNSLKKNTMLTYECSKNDFNFQILEELGFSREDGAIELVRDIVPVDDLSVPEGISFETFIRGKHEELRCRLQNSIFMSNNRDPLNIDDIYYDVMQDYFMEEGSIFMKLDSRYIGYGQIILDGAVPTIVNFGIINEFRSRGYGKILLSELFRILYTHGYQKVRLKVDPDNYVAYKLYTRMGFRKSREYYKWLKVI